MSTDLQTQIRDYAAQIEDGQQPTTMADVRDRLDRRDDVVPTLRPADEEGVLSRGAWPAVAAAVVVLIIFGVFFWVFPGDRPPPPADSVPPSFDRGYYTPPVVPDGFVLQDLRALGSGRVLFLREFEETWLPSDGGFAVHAIHGRPVFMPEDPDAYLAQILDVLPGSTRVEVSGRSGIIYETEFSQDDVTAPLISVLVVDPQGGVFEITALGMTRDAVLAVASGVHRMSGEEFAELGSQITWDVKIDARQTGFAYSPPSNVTDLADDVDVALGVDVLRPRLGRATQTTVVTTEDGEVVESSPNSATTADLFLEVPDEGIDAVLRSYPGAELSPQQRRARVDVYVEQVRGEVLSEDPYVIQAAHAPEPQFDTSQLGEEFALVPASSADVVPRSLFGGFITRGPASATEERPVIVIGTARQPNSDAPPVTVLVWFTETGVTCRGTTTGEGVGGGCGGTVPLRRFGPGFRSSGSGFNEVSYSVPLETSVVQIVTMSQRYWQRPIGGYGVVPWGDTIDEPTTIIAYDVDGNEISTWDVQIG